MEQYLYILLNKKMENNDQNMTSKVCANMRRKRYKTKRQYVDMYFGIMISIGEQICSRILVDFAEFEIIGTCLGMKH